MVKSLLLAYPEQQGQIEKLNRCLQQFNTSTGWKVMLWIMHFDVHLVTAYVSRH